MIRHDKKNHGSKLIFFYGKSTTKKFKREVYAMHNLDRQTVLK